MPFGSSQWMYASGAFYNGVATQSLRFDSGSNAYLSKTPSSAGNQKTWTWSGWVKRSKLGLSSYTNRIFNVGSNTYPYGTLYFHNTDKLYFLEQPNSSDTNCAKQTSAVFRDTSAWYHIVVAIDTTQATAGDRTKLYVNGEQLTSFDTDINFSLNADSYFNSTNTHYIGYLATLSTQDFDGYMAEVNFVDGSALDPTSFGETKNGVWIPKAYTGSYGTNGFRLQFNQTGTGSASSSTIGADTSGNDNHFTSSGIVASDCDMPDSPENNFATICPLSSDVSATFSEGNLKYYSSQDTGNANQGISSGKFYAEVYISGGSNSYVGVCDIGNGLNPNRGGDFSGHGAIAYKANGDQYSLPSGGSSATASYGDTYTSGDIIGIAVDVDSDTVTFYKNGVSQGNTTNGVSHISSDGVYSLIVYGTFVTFIINFGQDPSFAGALTGGDIGTETPSEGAGVFKYAVPSGYLALCTANLPEPTISPNASTQADDYFNTVLYTGTGASGNAITGVGFQSDWVWIKERSGSADHGLYDSVRGVQNQLESNNTNAETTEATGLTAFGSDGFTVGALAQLNTNTDTYVSWNWKAGGTAVSNTDGSITSSVSANTDAGFSIVSYTSNNTAGATVGHGLGKVPAVIITKNREDARNWGVYHHMVASDPETDALFLNLTNAVSDNSAYWNDTAPTSTVFSLGSGAGETNYPSSDGFVAYCFAEIEGYSKFGSYIGNGSSDGTFVYLGFRPAFLMVKNVDTAGETWHMFDSVRATYNVVVPRLIANGSNPENNNDNILDFTSNGFKWRDSNAGYNGSGDNYIYMCFAENPFKYANAR